jgi:hypothetical protein
MTTLLFSNDTSQILPTSRIYGGVPGKEVQTVVSLSRSASAREHCIGSSLFSE